MVETTKCTIMLYVNLCVVVLCPFSYTMTKFIIALRMRTNLRVNVYVHWELPEIVCIYMMSS
jgi:hypothetical protein